MSDACNRASASALAILERSFRPIEVPSRPYVGCQRCGTAVSGVYPLIGGGEVGLRDEITEDDIDWQEVA